MRALVIGSTGLLGINLIRRLVADGHSVRALVRRTSQIWPIRDLPVERVLGDLQDVESLKAAAKGCDVAFNCAGHVDLAPFAAELHWRTNVRGVQNVIEACKAAKTPRLVFTSSIGAIGYGPAMNPADEDVAWNLGHVGSPYFESKLEGEQLVLAAASAGEIDAVVVNPAFILGRWDIRPSSGRLLLMVARWRMPFYFTGGVSVVHVDDVVDGLLRAYGTGRTGRRYILGGENLSYREIFNNVADIAHFRRPWFAAHEALLRPLARAGDLLGRIWPSAFCDLNSPMARTGCMGHYVTSQRAVRELGYQYRPARLAIEDALAWFVDYGYVTLRPRLVGGAPERDTVTAARELPT